MLLRTGYSFSVIISRYRYQIPGRFLDEVLTCIQLPCWLPWAWRQQASDPNLSNEFSYRVLCHRPVALVQLFLCRGREIGRQWRMEIMLQNEIWMTWWREVLWCGDEPDRCSSCCQEPYLESWSKMQVLSSAISTMQQSTNCHRLLHCSVTQILLAEATQRKH